ncbi:MAG: hypothetical protein NWS66_02340 [Saprospiraceae bacterium]|nr:hypothetical protein [Saprospiraceae bacterium]MDP4698757.1 hypothetical protein [Saprospiraceae bacterium]MDP4810364.1 hypothetical protein [Saprospiraceae bacterium]MDP4813333.1 hypothetical protein [Saprospiraceae bacterium]MDP4851899.1 hypothetical protein [Saprospiraceae bacterium]
MVESYEDSRAMPYNFNTNFHFSWSDPMGHMSIVTIMPQAAKNG